MIVHARHPIRALIDDNYRLLTALITGYPSIVENWISEQEKEVEKFAEDFSEGDPDICLPTYQSQIQRVYNSVEEFALFDQSMLIMVYSYYESMIYKLSKEIGANNRPSAIAEKKGMTLDKDSLQIANFLHETIRPLRNELCHNNNGTLFSKADKEEKEKIIELAKSKIIRVDNVQIILLERSFISMTLEKEYKLLCVLADICGFKQH